MPWYNDLRPTSDDNKRDYALVFPNHKNFQTKDKIRTIEQLLELRKNLDEKVPPKKADNNLLIASWNIKEFGHTTQRLPESYFYIAEILNKFDLIAIQEVKSGLEDLYILMRLLGSDWAYMINDITEGVKGNNERSAYIYNKMRVKPSGLAGEITLWEDLTATSTLKQLHRSPYITGFKTGWKQFSLINLHLTPGDDDNKIALRFQEIQLLLKAIQHKIDKNHLWNENLILIGDMNMYKPTGTKAKDQPAVQELLAAEFEELNSLIGVDTNASQSEAYDRMFFHVNEYFKFAKEGGMDSAGVYNFFDTLFDTSLISEYKDAMMDVYGGSSDLNDPVKLKEYFLRYWRRNQLSDHFPIWAELITDSSDDFLTAKKIKLETPNV